MSRKNEYSEYALKNSKDGHSEFITNSNKKLKSLTDLYKKIKSDYQSAKNKPTALIQLPKMENLSVRCLKDCGDLKKTFDFEIKRIQKNIDKSDDKIEELEYKKRYYSSNSDRKRAGVYSDYIEMEYIRNKVFTKQLKETKSCLYETMSLESKFEELYQSISTRRKI